MNERLIKEFTFDEVKRALDSTVDLKAHEPNGLSMIFFKKLLRCGRRGKLSMEVSKVLNGARGRGMTLP
jgi:hypothetical protein